ncbi:MAG: radical SAM protein [Enterobacteriaceae bacterium]|nr:radical SAM protein [Enterobacteriaceae bacterium]
MLPVFEYPSFIQLNITNQCNLRCKHCFNDSGIKNTNELTDEEIFNILNYFLSKKIVCITFGGGEALMHNKIFDFIKYAKKRNGQITLLSNGLVVNKSVANKLYKSGIFRMRISLDGSNKKINDFIRSKGSFDGAVSALKNLLSVPIPEVAVMTTINKYNYDDLENIIKLLIKIGIKDVKFIPTISEGRAKKDFNKYILAGNFMKLLLKKKEDLVKKYKKHIYISIDSPLEAIIHKTNNKELQNCGPCLIGQVFLGIKSNGDIFTCPMLDNVIIGNVRKNDIGKIWRKSKILNQVRNLNLLKGKCQDCKIKCYCGGGCRAMSYLNYNDTLMPDPCCWL